MKRIITLAIVATMTMGAALAQAPKGAPKDSTEKVQIQRKHPGHPHDGKDSSMRADMHHEHHGHPHDGKHHHHHPGGPHAHQTPAKPQEIQKRADGIGMDIVGAFPTVKSVKSSKKWTEVYDANGKLLGYAVYSQPESANIKGYAGETPVMVALSPKKKIMGVYALPNIETPRFAQRVNEAGYYNSWNGLSVKQALKKKVDTVSGATFTSRAIAESVVAALKKI